MAIERESPETIVERAIAGDELAFARIVAAHHEAMARIAYLVSGDVDMAQDAEQAAWAIAWRKLGSLRDPDRLRPWLMSLAANEARQLVRGGRRRTVREIAVSTADRPIDPDRAALLDLAASLRRLDARDRSIIGLRFVAGLDSAEIGRAVGLSPSGVRVRLARILGRLREELGDD